MSSNPNNQIVSNVVVGPIDRTAATPSISFGAGATNNSGTGIRGAFGQMSHSINGSDVLTVNPTNITTATGVDTVLSNSVCILSGAGVPTDAVTGANLAEKGSLYIDITAGKAYINGGTKASPTWKIVTSA